MKKSLYIMLFTIISAVSIFLLVSGCSKNNSGKTTTYTIYSPVYKSKTAVIAAINGASTTPVAHAGKLYIKDNFIYLNDINKGIHIIDNTNPSNPVQVNFLDIPGNLDIAIKGNILYADMYDELLAFDITDPRHAVITGTLNNFFIERMYVNNYVANDDTKIAVDWIEKDTTVPTDNYLIHPGICNGCMFLAANSTKSDVSASGTAGSMASMVLMNDYLYAISERHSLGIVDVSNPSSPKLDSSFFAGYDLETIYPFEDKLFLGSAIGMFMYDVSDPQHPVSIGEFEHGRACDPVIADNNFAYVTLHAGTSCGGDANELDVINVQDIKNSTLVKTYDLTKPTGLCKDGNLLFVCDSTAVKIYNATDPSNLTLLKQVTSNDPYDAIAGNNKLLVVAADGLYQYDYSNLNNIRQLSFIAAKQ